MKKIKLSAVKNSEILTRDELKLIMGGTSSLLGSPCSMYYCVGGVSEKPCCPGYICEGGGGPGSCVFVGT